MIRSRHKSARGGRLRAGASGVRETLGAGARETAARTAPFAGRALAALARPPLAAGRAIRRASRATVGSSRASAQAARVAAVELLDRIGRRLEPPRVVAFVCCFASAALAVSQFVDYSSVEVLTVRSSDRTTGGAHLYVLVPVALGALAASWLALRASHWRLGRTIALLGAIGLATALVVDLPKGLDAGSVGEAYARSEAILEAGFWVELSSSVMLVVGGLLLVRYRRDSAHGIAGVGMTPRRSSTLDR